MSAAQKVAAGKRKKRFSGLSGAAAASAADRSGARSGRRSTLHLLFDPRLNASGEKCAERTAHGDGGQRLSIPLDCQKRRGDDAGEKDERAEDEVLKVVSHVVVWRLGRPPGSGF